MGTGEGALRTQLGFCSRLRISARLGMSSIPATRKPYARAERWCVRRALFSSGSALLVVRLSALVGRLSVADAVAPHDAGGGAVRRIWLRTPRACAKGPGQAGLAGSNAAGEPAVAH